MIGNFDKRTIPGCICVFLFLMTHHTSGLPKDNAFKKVIKGESLIHILLIMRANSTYGLADVLSNTPPCPGMLRSKSSFDRQIINSDYYGSSLLDVWKEHTPDHVSLLITNYKGDILWGSSFRVQDKNSSELHTWFQSENIVHVEDYIDYLEPSANLTTTIGTPGFSATLQKTTNNNTAYLAIKQQSENISSCSKRPSSFYFSSSSSAPFEVWKGYQNVDAPLTQTEAVLKTTNVTERNETKVDFGNQTAFVTAVHVYNQVGNSMPANPCQYQLFYSTQDCTTDKYHSFGHNMTYDCGEKVYLRRGVQRVRCLLFTLPDLTYADIDIYGIEEAYIAGPVLILLGHYDHNPLQDDAVSSSSVSDWVVKSSMLQATETVSTTLTVFTTETVSTTTITTRSVCVSVLDYETVVDEEPAKSCCFCDCSMYIAYYKWNSKTSTKSTDLVSVTNELKANTSVKKTILSSYVRTKTCAFDPRPAARYVGTCGIFLIIVVLVCIILVDISSWRTHIRTLRQDVHNCTS
ncbi:uncharacterized protein LOC132555750 [Ylistrum balloti]|uniref:uncharacterized protein LOC132555750 n=1 Tax=Ylistrum balloti TaxID=509963 RepID=UPI002905AF22|nr:uncharacterized protein LOC132555750 [Ylistrum balloti]